MQKTINKENRKHRVLGPPKGPDTSEAGAAPPPRPNSLVLLRLLHPSQVLDPYEAGRNGEKNLFCSKLCKSSKKKSTP